MRGLHARQRPGLVDDVDGLVGEEAVIDVLARQLGGRPQRLVGVGHPVVLLVARAQAEQDAVGLLDRRLGDLDLLEAARQGAVLLEILLVLLVGGGADAAQLARGQRRLQDVGGVQRTARDGAGADDGVDLVDEEDGVLLALQGGQHLLQPLLEIAAVARAGQQRAHVQGVDADVPQRRRHLALHHALGQPLGDGRLAHAGVADVDGIVLEAAAEHLQRALQDLLAADERLAFAGARLVGELMGVELQEFPVLAGSRLLLLSAGGFGRRGALLVVVGDDAEQGEAADPLAQQQVGAERLLFLEQGGVEVADLQELLFGGQRVDHGPLHQLLKAERRHGIGPDRLGHALVQVSLKLLFQQLDVGAAAIHDPGAGGEKERGIKDVLRGQVLVLAAAGVGEGHGQDAVQLFLHFHPVHGDLRPPQRCT